MTRTAEVSNQVTSIDRLLKYASLPPESQPQEKGLNNLLRNNLTSYYYLTLPRISNQIMFSVNENLSDEWPSTGSIHFENVGLRYNPSSPPSIENVSFKIQPQEKVSQ